MACEYNNLTLAKGIGYPIWVALCKAAHIDLLFAQHLLYIFACFLFVSSVTSIIPNKNLKLIILVFLIFNPATYADHVGNRVIRDGIYPAVTLITIALAIKLFFSYKNSNNSSRQLPYWLSFFFSYFWIIREEGIWIFPAIFILIITSAFLIKRNLLSSYIKDIFIKPLIAI